MYFAPKVILLIESRKIKLTEHVAFVREMEIVSRILVRNPIKKEQTLPNLTVMGGQF